MAREISRNKRSESFFGRNFEEYSQKIPGKFSRKLMENWLVVDGIRTLDVVHRDDNTRKKPRASGGNFLLLELYQSEIISAFICCGCAATAFIYAVPQKNTSVRLCRKTKTEKIHSRKDVFLCGRAATMRQSKLKLYQNTFFYVFVLRQSRTDVFLCGKAAWTKAVAAQPQQINVEIISLSYKFIISLSTHKTSLLIIFPPKSIFKFRNSEKFLTCTGLLLHIRS